MVSDLTLDFKDVLDWNSGSFDIEVDAYDGSTWTNGVWSETVTADIAARDVSVDLTPYISANTYIRFAVRSHTPGDLQWWHIDDVTVTGTQYFTAPDELELHFDAWWDIEEDYDYVYLEIYDGCAENTLNETWIEVKNWTNNSFAIGDGDGWYHENIDLEPFVTGNEFMLRFRLFSDPGTELRGMLIDDLYLWDGTDYIILDEPDPMDDMDNWCVGCWNMGDYWDDFCIDIPDFLIDNALIWETEINDAYEAWLVVNHSYEFSNIIPVFEDDFSVKWWESGNWTNVTYDGSMTWHTWEDTWAAPGNYRPMATWFQMLGTVYEQADATDFFNASIRSKPLDLTVIPFGLDATVNWDQLWYTGSEDATIETLIQSRDSGGNLDGEILLLDLMDKYGPWEYMDGSESESFDPYSLGSPENVTIEFHVYYPTDADGGAWIMYGDGVEVLGATDPAIGTIEISIDGGVNWHVIDQFIGTTFGEDVEETYDITPWAGNDILIRFRVQGSTDSVDDRYWCINDAYIAGKSDDTAPASSATMSGTMKESGWYTTSVKVTINAEDLGIGMGEIHYILDGSETVVSGDKAEFTVSGNGPHNIEYWAVDAMGNEETPHNTIPEFRIDMGSPPTVQITAPEPGLYLFGNKLLSASKVIIIGAFTVEATASDAESGIYRVQFFLDGDLVSEDTELPFSAYIAERHMGAGTIKVVAEDFAQNTAEDTLDITYYKFF
jgi:hypothetical protein